MSPLSDFCADCITDCDEMVPAAAEICSWCDASVCPDCLALHRRECEMKPACHGCAIRSDQTEHHNCVEEPR